MKKVTEFIWNAPGLWIAKNKNSVYQGISREFLGMFGWKDIDQIAGKTDHDIPCKVSEFANVFISQDRQAVESREKLLTLEIMPFASGWRSVLVERRGISDEKGNADGVLLQAIDVSESSIFRKCMLLNSSDQKTVDTSNKMASYILSAEHSPLPLTKQQEACLFLLIRGKCTKQIADMLNISVRTVEFHIEAMRHKLDCCSKSQLIEKAINSGYFYYIPKGMQY